MISPSRVHLCCAELEPEKYATMVESAFRKANELTTSRILQYFYMVIVKYAQLTAPKPPRSALNELLSAAPEELSVVEVAHLQRHARSLLEKNQGSNPDAITKAAPSE